MFAGSGAASRPWPGGALMRSLWLRALLFAGLWWVLSDGSPEGWVLGGLAVVAATWASAALRPAAENRLRLVALPGRDHRPNVGPRVGRIPDDQ